MVDMEPHALVWPPSPTRLPPTDDETRTFQHSKDGPLQPVPSVWTTLRLLATWHWASAGQHYQASRAREQVRSRLTAYGASFMQAPSRPCADATLRLRRCKRCTS